MRAMPMTGAFDDGMLGFWNSFACHREKVSELLSRDSRPAQSRLCVLGAGCCNDLDLQALVRLHREVHLVDLDAGALDRGVAWQALQDCHYVRRHGGMDVTGVRDKLAQWSPSTTVTKADLAACRDLPARMLDSLPGPFDVAASTCLLSQLMRMVTHAVGQQNASFVELLQAVRVGHLRLLCELVAPGGLGIIITDILSSEFLPELGSVEEKALPSVVAQLIEERKFFSGVNPAAIRRDFRTDSVASSEIADVQSMAPWLWTSGPWVYAVCAWTFRRAASKSSRRKESGQHRS